ncbi:MAG: FAD binding domain-containing protein, partial [Spirochaetia bacterium]
MLQEFNFQRAETVDEVLERLASSGEKIQLVAGGTDVMISLRYEELSRTIEEVLDISGIDELKYVHLKEADGKKNLHIGAATPLRQIAGEPIVQENMLVLHKAAESVGSLQVRTRGTIGGNIVTAAQCADTVPALLVLDAVLVLKSKNGSREIAIEKFFTGPKQTDLRADELLT